MVKEIYKLPPIRGVCSAKVARSFIHGLSRFSVRSEREIPGCWSWWNFLSSKRVDASHSCQRAAKKGSLASPTRVTREIRAVPFLYRRACFPSPAHHLLFLYPAGKIFFESIFKFFNFSLSLFLSFCRIFYHERIVD